jgi:hypothetical protein
MGAPLGAVVAPPPGVLARVAMGSFAAPPGAGARPPFRLAARVPPLPLSPPANSEPLPTSGRSVLQPVGKRPALGPVVPLSPRAFAGFNPRAVNQITGKEILPRRLEELGILRGAAPPGAGAAAAAPGASALGGAPSPGAAAAAPGASALGVAPSPDVLGRGAAPGALGGAPAPSGAGGVASPAEMADGALPALRGAPSPGAAAARVPPLPLPPPANSEPLPTSGRSVLQPVGKRPALGPVVPLSPRALAGLAQGPAVVLGGASPPGVLAIASASAALPLAPVPARGVAFGCFERGRQTFIVSLVINGINVESLCKVQTGPRTLCLLVNVPGDGCSVHGSRVPPPLPAYIRVPPPFIFRTVVLARDCDNPGASPVLLTLNNMAVRSPLSLAPLS